MQNSQNKKTLQIVLVVLIAVLTLGIGYASITAINLIISGNATASVDDSNFKVYFVPTVDTPSLTGNVQVSGDASISTKDNMVALFDVSGLTKEGDYAIATYTIINDSYDVGADITLNLTNSNPDYFKVTERVEDNKLQAGDTTIGTIKVEMIKTPVDGAVSTSVTGTLTANPIENREASGGEAKEETKPTPPQYIYVIKDPSDMYINLNSGIPNEIRTYNNFAAAKADYGHPAALANIVENGVVTESYVVYETGNKLYYLRGGVSDSQIYSKNVEKVKEIYGSNWESYCTESETDFLCHKDGLEIYLTDYGRTQIYYSNGDKIVWRCVSDINIYNTHYSRCD